MTSKLHNLTGPGKSLVAEPPDRAEFVGLIKSATARLRDAANTSLALESRFDLAYNAAHVRNVSEYEGDLNVDERLVTDLVTATQAVATAVEKLALP